MSDFAGHFLLEFFFGLNKKVDDIDVTSLMMKPPFLPSINHAFSPLSLEL